MVQGRCDCHSLGPNFGTSDGLYLLNALAFSLTIMVNSKLQNSGGGKCRKETTSFVEDSLKTLEVFL
jgi:hypothetical protein